MLTPQLRYGSVCSGIEAASCAWRPLGWESAFVSEIEPFPCAVLAHRFPDVPNLGDMTKFEDWPDAAIDVLVGGTPCQSFSVAGLRKGLADPRGNLMLTFGAIARRYRPRWLVWENVPGVLSSGGGRDFGTFLGMLGELGYGFAYRVLDAQYFGLAQRRRRVFVVGCLGDWRAAAAVLFERHSLSGHPAPSREARKVAPTLPSRSTGGGGLGTDFDCDGGLIPTPHADISPALKARDSKGPSSDGDGDGAILVPMVAHALRVEGFDASEDGTGRGTPIIACHGTQDPDICIDHAHTLARNSGQENAVLAFAENSRSEIRLEGGDGQITGAISTGGGKPGQGTPCIAFSCKDHGGDAGPISPTLRSMGHDGSHANSGGQVAVAFQERGRDGGRVLDVGGDVAYALTAPSGGGRAQERNVLTPTMQVRRLTPRECERLQGFPDDWTLIPWTYYQRMQKLAAKHGVSFEEELRKRGKTLRGPELHDCPDGPRYKALGNSMAVPVMHWIGSRLKQVEMAIRRAAA